MKGSNGAVIDGANELVYRISPSEPPSEAVIEAVSEATGASVDGANADDDEDVLEPLYGAIDPDALDDLFHPTARGVDRTAERISFVYEGCDVEVRSSGVVTVQRERERGGPVDTDE